MKMEDQSIESNIARKIAVNLIDKHYWLFGDGYLDYQHIQHALLEVNGIIDSIDIDYEDYKAVKKINKYQRVKTEINSIINELGKEPKQLTDLDVALKLEEVQKETFEEPNEDRKKVSLAFYQQELEEHLKAKAAGKKLEEEILLRLKNETRTATIIQCIEIINYKFKHYYNEAKKFGIVDPLKEKENIQIAIALHKLKDEVEAITEDISLNKSS